MDQSDPNSKLTDEQVRAAFTEFRRQLFNAAADMASFQKALLKKGLVTEADVAEAKKEVLAEMKEQIDKFARAIGQLPSGEIQ